MGSTSNVSKPQTPPVMSNELSQEKESSGIAKIFHSFVPKNLKDNWEKKSETNKNSFEPISEFSPEIEVPVEPIVSEEVVEISEAVVKPDEQVLTSDQEDKKKIEELKPFVKQGIMICNNLLELMKNEINP